MRKQKICKLCGKPIKSDESISYDLIGKNEQGEDIFEVSHLNCRKKRKTKAQKETVENFLLDKGLDGIIMKVGKWITYN